MVYDRFTRKGENMVSVWRTHLDRNCESLQYQAKKRYYEIQRIGNVISSLNSLSGMNHAVAQLKAKKNELEEQQQKLLDMIQGLMKISWLYRTAENRIVEQGDACRVRYKYSFQLQEFTKYSGTEKLIRID